jgi:hypothetical protein
VSALGALGCATTSGTVEEGGQQDAAIWNIRLSTERGEVGKPFLAEITFQRDFEGELEFDISSLPPGLTFDEKEQAIVGKPTKAGFFTVNVAIRKKIKRGRFHKPKPDERWFRGETSVEIYQPLKD